MVGVEDFLPGLESETWKHPLRGGGCALCAPRRFVALASVAGWVWLRTLLPTQA